MPCLPGQPEGNCRVLIVNDDPVRGRVIAAQVQGLCGRVDVVQAVSAGEATQTIRARAPDVVLLDSSVQGFDGADLARILLKECPCAVVMLSDRSDTVLIERAIRAGVFGFLIHPVSTESLQAHIAFAVHRYADYNSAVRQNHDLSAALENRKLVERAKGILMRQFALDEPQAHRRLQTESQARRVSLADYAREIIQADSAARRSQP